MLRKLLPVLLLLVAVPCLGEDKKACSPAGTWYGGSEWKYVLTILPNADGTYAFEFQEAYDLEAMGFPNATDWSGQMVRRGPRDFAARALAMYVLPTDDPAVPPPTTLDIVQGSFRLTDACNTLVNTIDVYGSYAPYEDDTVPFVTPVDVDYLPGEATIVETYHRMKLFK